MLGDFSKVTRVKSVSRVQFIRWLVEMEKKYSLKWIQKYFSMHNISCID